jgi:hypothetical protein
MIDETRKLDCGQTVVKGLFRNARAACIVDIASPCANAYKSLTQIGDFPA